MHGRPAIPKTRCWRSRVSQSRGVRTARLAARHVMHPGRASVVRLRSMRGQARCWPALVALAASTVRTVQGGGVQDAAQQPLDRSVVGSWIVGGDEMGGAEEQRSVHRLRRWSKLRHVLEHDSPQSIASTPTIASSINCTPLERCSKVKLGSDISSSANLSLPLPRRY